MSQNPRNLVVVGTPFFRLCSLEKRISKVMNTLFPEHFAIQVFFFTKLYWRYGTSHILSVFLWAFLFGQMVSSQKKAQYDMSKTTFGTQGQNTPQKRKEFLETIHYFDVSHKTFLPNFFYSSTSIALKVNKGHPK